MCPKQTCILELQAFRNCLKLNVSNTVLPTRPDLLFLLPLCLVYSVSTLQLHLSLQFPMARSSHALFFVHIHKAILATKSLIFQPETTSLFLGLSQYFCLWHSFNIFATQHWFCTHCRQVLCHVISFKNHCSLCYFIPILQKKWILRQMK